VFQENSVVALGLFVRKRLEGPIVKHIAILVYFYQGAPTVGFGPSHHLAKVCGMTVHASGQERSSRSKSQGLRIDGMVHAPEGGGFGDRSGPASGRILAFGEPVDFIVKEQNGHPDIPTEGMNQVVASNAQGIPIACN